jgi:dTDP-glucose pyrophosphorylase
MYMNTELDKICIPPHLPIKEAVQVLNEGHCRIVMVLDECRKLLGVVADSDIRKAILRGISFDRQTSDIMVKEPVVTTVEMKDREVYDLMCQTKCYEIPVLDNSKRVVGLRMIDGFISRKQTAEVIIMAGGLGTRLRPLTETKPKPLITIGGKPILFILLDQLILAGFQKITLSINYKAEMIKDAIAAVPAYAAYVRFIEETKRMGTAGSLSLLEHEPTSPFFVMNADLLTKVDFKAMLHFHEAQKNHLSIATLEEVFQVPFGVLKMNESEKAITGIEEKPVHRYLVNAGIYILDPSMLRLIPADTFYDMPDLINDAISVKKIVGNFPIHEYWLDIGRHEELKKARKEEVCVC